MIKTESEDIFQDYLFENNIFNLNVLETKKSKFLSFRTIQMISEHLLDNPRT